MREVSHTFHLSEKARYATIAGILFLAFIIELVGVHYSGSIALLGDAGHVVSDVVSWLVLFWVAWLKGMPAELIGAVRIRTAKARGSLLNGVLLLLVLILAFASAIYRFGEPHQVHGLLAALFIAIGLLLNYACLLLLRPGGQGGILERSAWLHVLFDTLSSACALLSAALVWYTGVSFWDTISSIVIVLILTPAAVKLLRDARRELRAVQCIVVVRGGRPPQGAA